ncbi:MAG: FAD-dependent oxidoreductase [Gammaproteobacteria bacterium]|nr:FAD-dependent oxidoreductase [Gammaproteobacteria bacterium]
MCDVLIIGGGLSGLQVAAGLISQRLKVVLLEARPRLGGRILGLPGVADEPLYDAGPAWVWPDLQPRMSRLLAALDLETFAQETQGRLILQGAGGRREEAAQTFASAPASMRVTGGLSTLVARLEAQLRSVDVQCDTVVTALACDGSGVCVTARCGSGVRRYRAPTVVVAVPPRLVAGWEFAPALPAEAQARLAAVPTWMAGHAKCIAVYPKPFWRAAGLSGQAFSQVGPLGEIHDASVPGHGQGALMGFFTWPHALRKERRERLVQDVCAQLGALFGAPAAVPTRIHIHDWAAEPFTATAADTRPLHEHPVYRPLSWRGTRWEGRLLFAGTEVAAEQGGYLEGALAAAERALAQIRGTMGP